MPALHWLYLRMRGDRDLCEPGFVVRLARQIPGQWRLLCLCAGKSIRRGALIQRQRLRSRNACALYRYYAIGFCQRSDGRKRAKSPSVEHSVRPCSSAKAARCASGTRLACTPGRARKPSNSSVWCSVGCGIQTTSQESQARTCFHAFSTISARSKTRVLVTRRKNASKLSQGMPTRVEPLSCRSSQACADLCWAKDSTCA
jgi:hypothetical protein